jgi:serine phosphatase RsbU (regulator of sigma subunit)
MSPTLPVQVLLVEDDAGDALLVEELLAESAPHMTIVRVTTLREALELLPGGIDCVLLDLGLPDATGIGSIEELHRVAHEVAIVVLTGFDDARTGIAALGAGAQDYLAKSGLEGPVLARAIRYAVERRHSERAEQELLEAQLHASENARLERGLLPTALVADPRLALTTGYRPGRRRALLGGDFYDAHVMIGDVSGHGPDEAALGACLRIAWRTLVLARRPPEETLALLQEMLRHERHAPDMFATLCVLTVAPDRTHGEVFLAGHPPPVLVGERGIELLDVEHVTPPLGFVDAGGWRGNPVGLGSAWGVLLYTDGLIEGRIGRGSERLGSERLVRLLERVGAGDVRRLADASPLLDELVAEVERLHGGDLLDDLAMVMVATRSDGA